MIFSFYFEVQLEHRFQLFEQVLHIVCHVKISLWNVLHFFHLEFIGKNHTTYALECD